MSVILTVSPNTLDQLRVVAETVVAEIEGARWVTICVVHGDQSWSTLSTNPEAEMMVNIERDLGALPSTRCGPDERRGSTTPLGTAVGPNIGSPVNVSRFEASPRYRSPSTIIQ
jgi:hypothetical protein